MSVKQIWTYIDKGITVYWKSDAYKVYATPIYKDIEFQVTHFSTRDGLMLSVRRIDNYFGSIINETDLNDLFIKEVEK